MSRSRRPKCPLGRAKCCVCSGARLGRSRQRQLEARLAVEAWLREVNPEPTPEELDAIEREWQGAVLD
jgi:hypothetical protein